MNNKVIQWGDIYETSEKIIFIFNYVHFHMDYYYDVYNGQNCTNLKTYDTYSIAVYYLPYLNRPFALKFDILLNHGITELGKETVKKSVCKRCIWS